VGREYFVAYGRRSIAEKWVDNITLKPDKLLFCGRSKQVSRRNVGETKIFLTILPKPSNGDIHVQGVLNRDRLSKIKKSYRFFSTEERNRTDIALWLISV